jgi:type II secretory pathway component HofQ
MQSIQLPDQVVTVLEDVADRQGMNLVQYLATVAIRSDYRTAIVRVPDLSAVLERLIRTTSWDDQQISAAMQITPEAVAVIRSEIREGTY